VETPDGVGTVSSVNLLRQKVTVRLEDDPETAHCYHNCEVCVVRSGKGKRPEGYVAPPKEELAKLRRKPDEDEPEQAQPKSGLAAALDHLLTDAQPAEPQPKTAEEMQSGEEHRRRRHRSRGRGNGPKPEGADQQPKQEQKPKTEPKPKAAAPEQGEAKAEGGEKKPGRHRHRHRHRKPGGGQGNPAPQQG
jgi:hypothetical protein